MQNPFVRFIVRVVGGAAVFFGLVIALVASGSGRPSADMREMLGAFAAGPLGIPLGIIIALVVAPLLFRAFGVAFPAPLLAVRWPWNKAVALFALPLRIITGPLDRLTPAGVDRWLERRTKGESDLLLKGDRLAFARQNWPESRYPTLYRTMPADVRRSVVWDGRVLGGYPVPWLAWRHVTGEVVVALVRAGGKIGVRAAAIVALLGAGYLVATVAFYLTIGGSMEQIVPYPTWSEGLTIWPRVGWYVAVVVNALYYAVTSALMVLLGSLLLVPAFMFFAIWRGFHAWWAKASEALSTPTRDSLVGWKHKSDVRDAEYAAYARQVDRAIQLQDEGQPTILVGRATGILRARGDMEAPERGQDIGLDGDSIRQHMLILGGTGAGKTRLAVRPLFNRIMSAQWGAGHRIGAYVTDGKGTLWKDLQNAPSIRGRDDVVVIGTADGQKAVNPLAGMSPLEVATTLKAVSGQVAGKPSDDFWPESASLLMLHAATIAEVLDLDEKAVNGPDWQACRPWSLVGIGTLATSQRAMDGAVTRINELAHEYQDNMGESDLSDAVNTAALKASLEWLEGTWKSMAPETKGGIIANVNIILGKLGGAGALRDRFATGLYADTVDIQHALDGGILMIAVGETEWGMVGKVISVWLKTRLYIEARKRLQSDPEACRSTSCAMFADEWQMLATTGPDSDATFWNVARETGVFLIAATQSLAALKQVLGDDATANLVNLLRTKLVLKTEEISTLDYCIKLAGETMRGVVVDDDFFETQGQREIERPDTTPAPDVSEAVTIGRVMPTYPKMDMGSMRTVNPLDSRFYKQMGGGPQGGGGAAVVSGQQAAFWRQEDKEKEAKGSGLQFRPKLTTDELLLGSGLAFAIIQRAGCDRSDIIDLQADEAGQGG